MNLDVVWQGLVGVVAVAGTVVLSPLLRGWYSHWGMTAEEARRQLPGDEYVPHPRSEINAAITIDAPPADVWPWFVQLGCRRGGWYAYDLLDNGGQPSADRVIPEFQHLKVGDMVAAVPNGSFGFPVAILEPERVLTLAGTLNTKTGQAGDPKQPPPEYFSGDQTFYLEPVDRSRTCLIFRMRTDWNPTFVNHFAYRGLVEPISFVMGRKMLLNIKRRAQARSRGAK